MRIDSKGIPKFQFREREWCRAKDTILFQISETLGLVFQKTETRLLSTTRGPRDPSRPRSPRSPRRASPRCATRRPRSPRPRRTTQSPACPIARGRGLFFFFFFFFKCVSPFSKRRVFKSRVKTRGAVVERTGSPLFGLEHAEDPDDEVGRRTPATSKPQHRYLNFVRWYL